MRPYSKCIWICMPLKAYCDGIVTKTLFFDTRTETLLFAFLEIRKRASKTQ